MYIFNLGPNLGRSPEGVTKFDLIFLLGLHGGQPHYSITAQGDLESRSIMGTIGVSIWLTGVINLLTKSP